MVNELRDGLTYESTNRRAGGLRIKRIYRCNNDVGTGEYLDKEYFYVLNYDKNKGASSAVSSGCLLQPPLYSYSYNLTSNDGNRHSFSFSSVQSIACIDGSEGHIGYSEVAEKSANGNVDIHRFSNFEI